ncbi:MAG TPA: chaperone modulator CbpM [Solirubrobacteraceae bacterium]|nr:chaperone modulator CbpM [Solirubrobacteraceae bacterium]
MSTAYRSPAGAPRLPGIPWPRSLSLRPLEEPGGTRAAPLFRRQDALLLGRAVRLRRDLGVNYAGAVLACELLARIDQLERRLATLPTTQTQHEVITWTPTA